MLNLKIILAAAVVSAMAISTSNAQMERFQYDSPGDKFGAEELKFDFFGTWGSEDRKRFDDGRFGLGVGVNYFFTKHFGFGADTYLERVDWPTHLDFSFIGRVPLEELSLAPYGFAGVGRQWHHVSQWTAHIGAGVEFRMNRNTGIFLDGRQVFPDRSTDFTLWRVGVRLGF